MFRRRKTPSAGLFHTAFADFGAIHVERHGAALRETAAVVFKLHPRLMLTGRDRHGCFAIKKLDAEKVVAIFQFSLMRIEGPAADAAAWATITPLAPASGTTTSAVTECDLFLRLTTEFAQAAHAAEKDLRVAFNELRPAGHFRVEALDTPVVKGNHVVLDRFDQEGPLQFLELFRILFGKVEARVQSSGPYNSQVSSSKGGSGAITQGTLCRVTAVHPL